jgi:hypothetical protein
MLEACAWPGGVASDACLTLGDLRRAGERGSAYMEPAAVLLRVATCRACVAELAERQVLRMAEEGG